MAKFFRKLSKKESKSLEASLAENGLPFDSLADAEKFFFSKRDAELKELQDLKTRYPELNLDYKAKSLKRLEDFYFKCYKDKKIKIEITKERFEELLTQYMRQVFVTNEIAEWMVFENDFAEGRYDLGVMYGYGSGGSEDYAWSLDKKPDNKERKYLYDKFMLYVPKERENEVQ